MASKSLFSIENPVFASFAFYSVAILLKMFVVQSTVSILRIARNVYYYYFIILLFVY